MSETSVHAPVRCFVVPFAVICGGASVASACISNWRSVQEMIRIMFTLGGIQWVPAVIALVASSVCVGCLCATEPRAGQDRDMSAAMTFTMMAAWVVGATAFLFTVGDLETITVFQGTAGVVAGLALVMPIFCRMIENAARS